MNTPWGQAKKTRSELQERRTGNKPGHRKQVNSGRRWHSLRDAIQNSPIGRVLIDNKDTEDSSYRITLGDWKDLKTHANRTPPGCQPGLQIDIRNLRLMVVEERTWDEVVKYTQVLESKIEELLRDAKEKEAGTAGEMSEVQDGD